VLLAALLVALTVTTNPLGGPQAGVWWPERALELARRAGLGAR
jgi:hypothetical protein